ncbi:MAG TPA: calcium-binding protein, partial [Blastocatellia bacterium]|nr:calcium-binding protein [Blastocatellia bacterium]
YDVRQFGISTDKVAQGDFDGDAKTDIAVYRQSNGTWYVWRSSDQAVSFVPFGQDGDMPVQSDYDGDGRVDRAVYRPSNGVWYMLRSSEGFGAVQFGIATDVPVPGDYD